MILATNYNETHSFQLSKTDFSGDQSRVATKIFESFRGVFCKEFIIVREPVSIVHYTRPGSSIKWPTLNYLATQCHVNWPVVQPKSSYKNMDPISAALPQILKESLLQLWIKATLAWKSLPWLAYTEASLIQVSDPFVKLNCNILTSEFILDNNNR